MKKLLAIILAVIFTFSSLPLIPLQNADAAPPANFQTNQIIGSGLNGPSGFDIAPDGRIFILERTGAVKVYKNGQLLSQPFVELPAIATGDRGLIGITFDPDWNNNKYVYFYYTDLNLLNRVVRFDATADVATAGPHILYETTSPSQQLHVGGSIQFGTDGMLYFAVGDNGYPPNAQELSNPHGKILRINKNGTVPADNPFVGQVGKLPEIWAYGFRNPWRFQFDNISGKLYGGDVGDFSTEEINRIEKGKNYGWPNCEGTCNNPSYSDPIHTYAHNGEGAAVTGGPVYRGNMFPSQYQGDLFFADYTRGFIKNLSLDANGNSTGVSDFDLSAGSVVDLKIAPDGSMYYITYFPGRLYRVTYSTGNQIPVASAGADNTKGIEPFTVNFTSAGSFDPDGGTLSYLWDFGDGSTSTQPNPAKTYNIKGTYIVELTVSDGTNSAQSSPIVIQVGTPPTVVIGEPPIGTTYKAGDTVHYTAFAQDGAGFDIDDNDIQTTITFHHNTHTHPFAGPITGRQGTFTIPTSGEAATDVFYRITTVATDTNGLSASAHVDVTPQLSNLTINSNVTGAEVFLDGVPTTTPTTREQIVNITRELNAPITQVINGQSYQFSHWSDGGSLKHNISVPETDTTITAFYTPAGNFTAEFFNNKTLTGTPALTRQDSSIDFDWGSGSPGAGINADNFSAHWTKDQFFPTGSYKFTVNADDGIRLYLDGNLVIDKWQDQVATYDYTTTLTEGTHNIKLEYYEAFGGAVAKLSWATTDPPQPGDGVYNAQYFNNISLSGTPPLTRQENEINHDWGHGSPGGAVPIDNFSARWAKTVNLEAGTYEFTATGDDGIRLFVDGEKILDKWIDQPATTYTVSKSLTAGDHQITYEYYEKGGGAIAKLSYVKTDATPPPPPPPGDWETKYWNNTGPASQPQIPTTAPTYQTTVPAIDFDWAGGSPHSSITNDKFIASYRKTVDFTAGTYKFTTTSDDGVRVYVGNQLVINQWNDHAPTVHSADFTLTQGQHEIKVEFYENGGGATIKFGYESTTTPPPPPPPTGTYFAEFWNYTGTPQIPTSAPVLTRQDATIDFTWNHGSPGAGVNTDKFITRWTKQDTFENGTYKFSTISDDGIRVYLDNNLVIDFWNDHGETLAEATVPVTAGDHTIRVEYYENGGGATAKASYTKVSDTTEPPTTFNGQFYNNVNLTGSPVLTKDYTNIAFNWGHGSPDPAVNIDNFSARFIANKNFTAGTHAFTVTADDGVRLYVDGVLAIDKWIDQPSTTYTANVDLTAGNHEIKIEYYERGGGAILNFN